MIKLSASFPLCFIMLFLNNCSTHHEAVSGINLRQALLRLPDNSCYEETKEEFTRRVNSAVLFEDPNFNTEYMYINGDGGFTQRLFIYDRKTGKLKMISEREDAKGFSGIYNEVQQLNQ